MNCNCLCVVNHPKVNGVCTGTQDLHLTFYSITTGHVHVPMCSACAAATLAKN